MDSRFFISVILTIGVFLFTLYLFVVAMLAYNEMNVTQFGCGTTSSTAPAIPQEAAILHPGEIIFKNNCRPCHAIDRKVVGPALRNVLDRRDSLWVIGMIRNSSKMIAAGDPEAVALFREYDENQMTSFSAFTDEELKHLLEYLRLASNVAIPFVAQEVRVEV